MTTELARLQNDLNYWTTKRNEAQSTIDGIQKRIVALKSGHAEPTPASAAPDVERVVRPKAKRQRAAGSKNVRVDELEPGDLVLYPGTKDDFRMILNIEKIGPNLQVTLKSGRRPFLWSPDTTIRKKFERTDSR